MGWFNVTRRVHFYPRRGWRRLAIVITNGSVRPLQNRSRQGAPKETPKRRQMLAFIKVGDLSSKSSKAVRIIMDINLNLVEHSVVCKKFSHLMRRAFRSFEKGDPQNANRSD